MGSARGGDGKFIRAIDQAQKDGDAARLRGRGWSYQRIADELDYCDKAAAYRAVQRVLLETVAEPAAELRQLEMQRLDALYEAALEVLERRHITVSNGKVVYDELGSTVLDDGPVIQAITACLRVQERRAKLLGLDAPTRMELVSVDVVDAAIRDLEAELARRVAPGSPVPVEGAAAAEG